MEKKMFYEDKVAVGMDENEVAVVLEALYLAINYDPATVFDAFTDAEIETMKKAYLDLDNISHLFLAWKQSKRKD